jgi:hypothetical protein
MDFVIVTIAHSTGTMHQITVVPIFLEPGNSPCLSLTGSPIIGGQHQDLTRDDD